MWFAALSTMMPTPNSSCCHELQKLHRHGHNDFMQKVGHVERQTVETRVVSQRVEPAKEPWLIHCPQSCALQVRC